ncbi:MAG: hypothetical protein ACOYBF_07165, partial [Bilifractor porci]
ISASLPAAAQSQPPLITFVISYDRTLGKKLFFGNSQYNRPVFILLFPSGKRKRENADETAGTSAF